MKTLEDYSKEFADHLNSLEYSSKTVQGYVIAVRQLLCDIIDNNNRDKTYKLKYTPKQLTLDYLKDFTRRVKEHYNPYSHKSKLCGIKYYLKFIKAVYGATIWDDYENEKIRYGAKKDILKGRPIQEKYQEPLTKGEIESFFNRFCAHKGLLSYVGNLFPHLLYCFDVQLFSVEHLYCFDVQLFSVEQHPPAARFIDAQNRCQNG